MFAVSKVQLDVCVKQKVVILTPSLLVNTYCKSLEDAPSIPNHDTITCHQ